jgi:hypothetical protein
MKKVVFLPLDERPCNYDYPHKLFGDSFNLVLPPKEILGDKKKPADLEKLFLFTEKELKDADCFVVSLEMLLYGGLLPSRLHYYTEAEIEKRLELLSFYKKNNPKLKIYAFSLIMRCPKYSSDDEEPSYYGVCGTEIHHLGTLLHKQKLNITDNQTAEKIEELKKIITKENLDDYLERRKVNLEINIKTLENRKSEIIDFLVIPQDDSAPYGFTAIDQTFVRQKIDDLQLSCDVSMYPGADEVGLTLLSRYYMKEQNRCPKVYLKYAACGAETVIPPYEDRPMGETIKYHIMSAGGQIVNSIAECDIVLGLTSPSANIKEARYQNFHTIEYDCFRNIPEFIFTVEDCISKDIPVMIGDNAYANGGELALLKILDSKKLMFKLAGYAGWNTNANTLGTVIATGFVYLINGNTSRHKDFLSLRYVEDFGYCSKVRFNVSDNELKKYGYNYFYIENQRGKISDIVKEQLEKFIEEYMPSIFENIKITDVYMPWRRMFETGLNVIAEFKDEKR